jgi:7-cyano-7-deazaguanine synthase
VIPHRNLVFWSLAANRARAVGAEAIAAGHTPQDARAYDDASPAFFRGLAGVLEASGIRELDGLAVRLPFHERPARHWSALARRHAPLLAATWSCWRNGARPCRACFACRQRAAALRAVDGRVRRRARRES